MKNYLQKFLVMFILILPISSAFGVVLDPVWRKTKATFEVKSVAKDKIDQHSIIGELIKFNDRGINYYLADDGHTLHHYTVTYSFALMVDKPSSKEEQVVIQHGLYRDLDPDLREKFKKRNSQFTLDVEYNVNDPQQFMLLYRGKRYPLNVMAVNL